MEELWFSDGGITSNFPIHLFDSPLPLWPTIGINLGGHPNGHQHQDVWLPTDSQARTSPPTPQKGSMFGFAAAIVSTARGWADTSQTFMPAFRGRVAWVRQRKSEGGTNLFMTKQTIASLALRGAVAGARLARRFGSDAHWERHQWLRLRVAMGNLAALRQQLSTAVRSPLYSGLLADPASRTVAEIRTALQQVGGDANPASDSPKQADGAAELVPVRARTGLLDGCPGSRRHLHARRRDRPLARAARPAERRSAQAGAGDPPRPAGLDRRAIRSSAGLVHNSADRLSRSARR